MNIHEACRYVDYNPQTGEIIHNQRKNSNGSIDHYGYKIMKIKGKQFKAHRLAWVKHYGCLPENVIDHINADKLDNRISNLRDVPQCVNVKCTKRKPNKTTGSVGIYRDNVTAGLKARFTTRFKGKTYRFRALADAINFRKERGLQV